MSWVKLVKVCYHCVGGACCRGRHLKFSTMTEKENKTAASWRPKLPWGGGGDLTRSWYANTTQDSVGKYHRRDRVGREEPVVWIHKPCFGFWKVEPRAPCQPLEKPPSLKKILRKKRREQHIESSLDNDVLQLRLAIRS